MKSLELAEAHPSTVAPFVGIHPSEAAKERDSRWLRALLARASGLGEVGLDPKYSDPGPSGDQMNVLREGLMLAEELDKPVQLHSRDAEAKCLEALGSYRLKRVLMHWLADEKAAREAGSRGYYLSFGPALLYSKKLARIVRNYPPELTLTESDGPVSFAPLGGCAGPYLVPSVAFRIAEERGEDFAEVRERLVRNGSSYLGHWKKG